MTNIYHWMIEFATFQPGNSFILLAGSHGMLTCWQKITSNADNVGNCNVATVCLENSKLFCVWNVDLLKQRGEITVPYPTPTTCGASGAFGGKNAGRGGGAVIAGPLGTAGAATAWGASILALGFTSSKKIISEHRAEMYVYIDVRVCIYIYLHMLYYIYTCTYVYIYIYVHWNMIWVTWWSISEKAI